MIREDLIKKYFTKSLTELEEIEFNELISSDSEFKSLVDEYSDFSLAFKDQEARNLKIHLKSLETKTQSKSVWYNNSSIRYGLAAILIVALCLPFLLKPSANSLYKNHFQVYPNVELPIVRGSIKNDAHDAFSAYENGNFSKAEEKFNIILKNEENPNYRYYYAMSLLNQNKFDEALIQLKQIRNSKYQAEIYWYHALIELKNKNYQNAKDNLTLLQSTESNFKINETKKLIDEIEKLKR